jgi:hypothetical protein
MGGRHKNFEDPRLEGQGNRVRKITIQTGFLKRPVHQLRLLWRWGKK